MTYLWFCCFILQASAARYARSTHQEFARNSARQHRMPHGGCLPHQAIDLLDSHPIRILLKRPEDHDKRFRELIDTLFHQVIALRGGLRGETLVRLEGGIFIISAASTTPFHFDPEINFFTQIEGEKVYHIYPPHSVTEAELERFYIRGAIAIGQVPLKGREGEHVFTLGPGKVIGLRPCGGLSRSG